MSKLIDKKTSCVKARGEAKIADERFLSFRLDRNLRECNSTYIATER